MSNAFADPATLYYLLWLDPENPDHHYLNEMEAHSTVHYRSGNMLIVSVKAQDAIHLYPSIHGGMVRISDREARLPVLSGNSGRAAVEFRADIEAMMAEVDPDSLQAKVQHLEDYGTRNAYTPESVQAQNWIFDKFASYGLSVELHDFTMPNGAASDNVIATLTGTVYPDEYVVLGAHYDSYAYGGDAPGADDNATGTAGILECARIMSQYSFDRSIIFATWSGEEYGLYGSEAWATEAAADGMNILGYFNMDMAGYLNPGDEIHTDIIAPASANELRQFYKDVCAIYLPDFGVYDGALSGGDSDHTSFNQNGFQGIFPFEDSQNYSPYIHSSNDIIGPSVNSFEMHETFTKAIIANAAPMAYRLPSPTNLLAMAGDAEVSLSWTGVEEVDHYNVYRDDETTPYDATTDLAYTDANVVNGNTYTYFVTAVFEDTMEESDPSNEVTVTPMPPIALPFFDDFETGGPYWTFEADWGLTQGIYHSMIYSMTESPDGEYGPNMNASATLRSIDLTGAYTAQISFWGRYRIENNYDYMHLEVSTDDITWDIIDTYTGNLYNWDQMTYSLEDYLGEAMVHIRFRFESDSYVEDQGMYIDDLEILVNGVGIAVPDPGENLLQAIVWPNPAKDNASLVFDMPVPGLLDISIYTPDGKLVKGISQSHLPEGRHQVELNTAGLSQGNYLLVLDLQGHKTVRKLVITR